MIVWYEYFGPLASWGNNFLRSSRFFGIPGVSKWFKQKTVSFKKSAICRCHMGHMPMCDGKLEKWCVWDISKQIRATSTTVPNFFILFFLLSSCVHWKSETECDFSDTAWATASKTSRAPCVAFLADDAHPAWPVWHLLLGSWNKSGIYRDDIEMISRCTCCVLKRLNLQLVRTYQAAGWDHLSHPEIGAFVCSTNDSTRQAWVAKLPGHARTCHLGSEGNQW